jgi:uncharacterized membrane protein YhaH (DUF805 family)
MSDLNDIAIAALTVVNFVAFVFFLALLGAILFSMARRLHDYRLAKLPVPVLLKRGFVLFAALAVMGGETAILRVLGISLADDPILRLIFTLQSDVILFTGLGYYAKAELFDVDDPDKP